MDIQRLVRRNRPGRGGPDYDPARLRWEFRQTESLRELVGLGEWKSDIDRNVLLVRVFDFSLGQRRTAVEAPVHRLQAAIDVAFFQQSPKHAYFVGLIAVGHGQIGMVPFAQNAEALEVLFLALHLLGGIGACQLLRLLDGNVLAVGLLDLYFNGHAVAVPARHIVRIKASELARLDDHILQYLVDRMPDVDVAVGIGRPVVQHELRPAFGGRANFFVDLLLFPFPHPDRLALGEVAAHREWRVGQVERGLVVRLGFRLRVSHCRFPGLSFARLHSRWRSLPSGYRGRNTFPRHVSCAGIQPAHAGHTTRRQN